MTLHAGKGRGPGHMNRLTQAGATGLALSFLNGGPLDPRITFTRSLAPSTRTNASGALENIGSNTARFDYSPTSIGTPAGLLMEKQATILPLNSDILGTDLTTQSVAVTAQAYTISFYGTGSVTLLGAATGTLNGSAVYPARVQLTFTPSAGTLTITPTGSVKWAMLEIGSIATSFVPTAGSQLTRSGDLAIITGSAFTSIYSNTGGTLIVEADYTTTASNFGLASFNNGTGNNRIDMRANGQCTFTVGGVSQALFTPTGAAINATRKHGLTWKVGSAAGCINGGTVTTATPASLPTVDRLQLGGVDGVATNNLNGHIRAVTYLPYWVTNGTLQTLTT